VLCFAGLRNSTPLSLGTFLFLDGDGVKEWKRIARLMIRAAAAIFIYFVCFIQRGFYILELQRAEDDEVLKGAPRGYKHTNVRKIVQSVLMGHPFFYTVLLPP
jgi:hypothetical protein